MTTFILRHFGIYHKDENVWTSAFAETQGCILFYVKVAD